MKISSKQSLTRYDAEGRIVKGTGDVRDVKEYLVIQKRVWQGREEEWLVWGTVGETTC